MIWADGSGMECRFQLFIHLIFFRECQLQRSWMLNVLYLLSISQTQLLGFDFPIHYHVVEPLDRLSNNRISTHEIRIFLFKDKKKKLQTSRQSNVGVMFC